MHQYRNLSVTQQQPLCGYSFPQVLQQTRPHKRTIYRLVKNLLTQLWVKTFIFTAFYINYTMARACKKTGAKKIRIHDIRHSHLYQNKHQKVVDMMQNQHQKDMAIFDVTVLTEASEEPQPQTTRFKVINPKDKISL